MPRATGTTFNALMRARQTNRQAFDGHAFNQEHWGVSSVGRLLGDVHGGAVHNFAMQHMAAAGGVPAHIIRDATPVSTFEELARRLRESHPVVLSNGFVVSDGTQPGVTIDNGTGSVAAGIDMGSQDGSYSVATVVANDRLPGDLDQDVFALRTLLHRREWEHLTPDRLRQLSPPRYHMLCDAAATWQELPRRSRARLCDVYGEGLVRFFDMVRDVVGNGGRRTDRRRDQARDYEQEIRQEINTRVMLDSDWRRRAGLPEPVATPATPAATASPAPSAARDWFPNALGLADNDSPF